MAGYLHERATVRHLAAPDPLADEARRLAPCPILIDIQADQALALLRQLRDEAPDALITDLMVPGMSGGELAEKLREQWPGLRVLFISGSSLRRCRRPRPV